MNKKPWTDIGFFSSVEIGAMGINYCCLSWKYGQNKEVLWRCTGVTMSSKPAQRRDHDGAQIGPVKGRFHCGNLFFMNSIIYMVVSWLQKKQIETVQKLKVSEKLWVVKEQILIYYLGRGWSEAHHPWSQSGKYFTPNELFILVSIVISLADKLPVPSEPPATLSSPCKSTSLRYKHTYLHDQS